MRSIKSSLWTLGEKGSSKGQEIGVAGLFTAKPLHHVQLDFSSHMDFTRLPKDIILDFFLIFPTQAAGSSVGCVPDRRIPPPEHRTDWGNPSDNETASSAYSQAGKLKQARETHRFP